MRFRLRTLLVLFAIASIILTGTVALSRWLRSRPGSEATYIGEVEDIERSLGADSLQDLRMWHLYGGWFGMDYLWQAEVSPEAIGCLTKSMNLRQISENQVPAEFWDMPPEISEIPGWWRPKSIPNAEYYMSPTFVPRDVRNVRLDGVVMYDPAQQRIYVWSQFDF
jgi:hypothetical protein